MHEDRVLLRIGIRGTSADRKAGSGPGRRAVKTYWNERHAIGTMPVVQVCERLWVGEYHGAAGDPETLMELKT